MIPIRDSEKTPIRPVVVIGIVVTNVLVFLLTWGDLGGAALRFGLIPAQFTGLEPEFGWRSFRYVEAWEWWFPVKVITSAWLHGGFLHIAMNMWFLWVFGDNVEGRLGTKRFIVFYVACAIGAVAAQVLSDPASPYPMIGASGALSGVLGAYMRLFPRSRIDGILPFFVVFIHVRWTAKTFFAVWLAFQILGAMSRGSNIAWWAHLGGFAVGYLLIPKFAPKPRRLTWTVGSMR